MLSSFLFFFLLLKSFASHKMLRKKMSSCGALSTFINDAVWGRLLLYIQRELYTISVSVRFESNHSVSVWSQVLSPLIAYSSALLLQSTSFEVLVFLRCFFFVLFFFFFFFFWFLSISLDSDQEKRKSYFVIQFMFFLLIWPTMVK